MPRKTLWALSSCIVFALCFASCSDDIADGGGGEQEAALPRKIAVIDAGSSGSRLKVYEIKADSTIQRLYPTTAEETKASKGGALSDVANHPDRRDVSAGRRFASSANLFCQSLFQVVLLRH